MPVYKEGALCLFESGAIVLHIGEKDERLLPRDELGRARAIAWMIAALNSIEPQTFTLAAMTLFFGDAPWSAEARTAVTPLVAQRLAHLSAALGDKDWLEDRFTIGDLMMVDALRAIPDQALVAASSEPRRLRRARHRPPGLQARDGRPARGLHPRSGRRLII